jgi:hypothetical protein
VHLVWPSQILWFRMWNTPKIKFISHLYDMFYIIFSAYHHCVLFRSQSTTLPNLLTYIVTLYIPYLITLLHRLVSLAQVQTGYLSNFSSQNHFNLIEFPMKKTTQNSKSLNTLGLRISKWPSLNPIIHWQLSNNTKSAQKFSYDFIINLNEFSMKKLFN